jgi:hypothetical protein
VSSFPTILATVAECTLPLCFLINFPHGGCSIDFFIRAIQQHHSKSHTHLFSYNLLHLPAPVLPSFHLPPSIFNTFANANFFT